MSHDVSEHDTDAESTPFERSGDGDEEDGDPPEPDVSPCYQAYLERRDDRPDSCTIYSAVTATEPEDCWIRAWGDGFVSREDAR